MIKLNVLAIREIDSCSPNLTIELEMTELQKHQAVIELTQHEEIHKAEMKTKYTLTELNDINRLRDQGCAVCVFLPCELGEMSTDDAEEKMGVAVNNWV